MPSYYRDPEAPARNDPRRTGVVAFVGRDGGLPGGGLDDEETVEGAIAREVREETGLEVVAADLFGVFSEPSRIIAYPDGNVFRLLTLAFVVQVVPGEPRIGDASLELRFVRLDRVRGLEIGPAQFPVVDAYLSTRTRPVVA